MGRYRARDLVNTPTLISLIRVPLAAAFPFALAMPVVSLALLGAAALTDVVDGFIARRFGLATPTGAVVDGVTDKLFVGTVLVSLLVADRMSGFDLLLLGTREVFELPLVVWLSVSRSARRRKVEDRANLFGKAATVLQFAAVVATLAHHPLRAVCLWSTAAVGLLAAASYWLRALRAPRVALPP